MKPLRQENIMPYGLLKQRDCVKDYWYNADGGDVQE